MNSWTGIIGIVIGALLGGGIAWFNSRFQLHHQAEKDRKKFILQKMEEIHELLSDLKHSYKMLTAEMLKRLATGKLSEMEDLKPIPSERLKMLIGFYVPELNDSLSELKRNEEIFGELLGNHLVRDNSIGEKKKTLGLLLHQSGKIGDVCEVMQKKVIELSKPYI